MRRVRSTDSSRSAASRGAGAALRSLGVAVVLAAAPLAAPSELVSPYAPAWDQVPALRELVLEYDPALSQKDNGEALRSHVVGLLPGDRLEVGAGIWRVEKLFTIDLQGSAAAPIRIVAAPGTRPVITRTFNDQNTVNLGAPDGTVTRFVLLRGFEITGGSMGLRMQACEDVWIDRCEIHHTDQAALVANTRDTTRLTITENEIHHTGGTGEGMYLGGNSGSPVMSRSVVAANHVHDTGGSQGDGIEIKQGSWGNRVVDNVVHDTLYPCLLVYGTGGKPVNVIERNVLYRSGDNVLQVQGEAIVQNNLIVAGSVGFWSHDHVQPTRDLRFVHNTILNSGRGAQLQDWAGRPGMVFANNAVYSESEFSVVFGKADATGVALGGNVTFGPVYGPAAGFAAGNGLPDFEDASFDGSVLGALPSEGGALRSAAAPGFLVPDDLHRALRTLPGDAGAYRYGSWGVHYGAGLAGWKGEAPRVSVSSPQSLGNPAFAVQLANAAPRSTAVLLVGTSKVQVPVGGGYLWNDAKWLVLRPTDPDGDASWMPSIGAAPGLAGVSVLLQWAVIDTAAPAGWSVTDGLDLVLD